MTTTGALAAPMTRSMMVTVDTDSEKFGKALASIEGIEKNTACLPALCETVARHDEKLKNVEVFINRVWGVGLIILAGIITLVIKIFKG